MIKTELWKVISSMEDLDKAVAESYERTVVIFKHSTRCSISKGVLSKFEGQIEESDADVAYYFLSLLRYRDISNEIAERFGVVHQSPQIIVLKDGKAVANASHRKIDISLVEEA